MRYFEIKTVAFFIGYENIAELLIEKDAEVNIIGSEGNTGQSILIYNRIDCLFVCSTVFSNFCFFIYS